MAYRARIVDRELTDRLQASGAVLVEGPKACGKTETARRQSASEVLLDVDVQAQQAVALDPSLILPGDRPRLIDEWQLAPEIWNHVRRAVDDEGGPGRFILTGSAVPADDAVRHTGAGRFSRLRMRPMSMFEAGTSSGDVSLSRLLAADQTRATDPGLKVADIAEEVVRGGWPGWRDLSVRQSMGFTRDYIEQVCRTDVSAVDGVSRDPDRVRATVRSVARHTATQATLRTIAADTAGQGATNHVTAASYLEALSRLMVIEDVPAWAPHLRSSHTLRKAPTRHFCDPSLAAAALRATPEHLLADLNTLGLLFESLAIRDLRVYAQANDSDVFHYRDQSGLEVDAIVASWAGPWAGFEIKLGSSAPMLDDAAANLLRFARRVDVSKRGEPAVLGVIVASGYGYVRDDGVHVIPVGALGP